MYASRERASITTMSARAALRSTDKSHRIGVEPQLVFHHRRGFAGARARQIQEPTEISFAMIELPFAEEGLRSSINRA